jgi:glycerol-3-phosphate dehydrogenase
MGNASLKVAVLGTGAWGKSLVRNFAERSALHCSDVEEATLPAAASELAA